MPHPQTADTRNKARRGMPGVSQPWADPTQVHEHVQWLVQAATFQAVAQAARVGQMTVWEVANGTRLAIKTETAEALLAITPSDVRPRRADANGSMWRLRSLVAMGHTASRHAAALGVSRAIIERLIKGDRVTVTTDLRDDINRLFDAWWDKLPPRRTPGEKTAACKALQRAAVNNWPCPAALDEDELDLPGYKPAARWRYALGTGIADDDPLGRNPQPGHRRQRSDQLPRTAREAGSPAWPPHLQAGA
jgi:hypothetical protein